MGEKRVRTPLRQRLGDFRRGPLTFLVWSAAVVGVVLLIGRRAGPATLSGIAQAFEYEVSSSEAGRLDTVHVELFEDVEAGAILATLDAARVEASIATAMAEIDRLRAEVSAERALLERDEVAQAREEAADLRSFVIDAEDLALDLVALRVQIEADRIELERLELLRERASEMFERALGPAAEVENYRLQVERVRSIVENNEILAVRTEEQLRDARLRRERYEDERGPLGGEEARLAALREGIRVQESRVEEVRVARRALVMRAPVSGRVTEVFARQGQVLLAGEPVARLVGLRAAEIVAYVPEHLQLEFGEGDRVHVARPSEPWDLAEAVVQRIGPAIEPLPERLWRDPAVAEYGRPLLIGGARSLGVLPGESVSVRLLD